MDLFLILDTRLKIASYNLKLDAMAGKEENYYAGKGVNLLLSDTSCDQVSLWWSKAKIMSETMVLEIKEELKELLPFSQKWHIMPLISGIGRTEFAVLTVSTDAGSEIGSVDTINDSPDSLKVTSPPAVDRPERSDEVALRKKDLHLLFDISSLINTYMEVDEMLKRIAEMIQSQLGYPHFSIYLLEDNFLSRRTFAGAEMTDGNEAIEIGSGVIGSAAYQCKSVVSEIVNKDAADPAHDIQVELAVPVKSKTTFEGEVTESVIGALRIISSHAATISKDEIKLFEALANIISVVFENSRLMVQVLELLQAEANHSKEMAFKKHELDEFIHTISHDLKNPLNNISGFAELLENELNESESENVLRYFNRIQANIDIVTRLISDLLELSRVGKVDEEIGPVALNKLVREIKYDFKVSYEEEQLELNCFNLPDEIIGNRHRINQLLTNLIQNAVKYKHPARPPKITITCIDEREQYHFSVTDNGIGIDEKFIDTIFVFGVRVKEKHIEGTGAGLAISKRIVESHGGRIWVESEKGEGSTFHFTIAKTPVI